MYDLSSEVPNFDETRPMMVKKHDSNLTDAPDEDLLGLVGLALALGRGVLRVDLLPVEAVRGHAQHAVHRVRRGERDEAEAAAPLQRETNMMTAVDSSGSICTLVLVVCYHLSAPNILSRIYTCLLNNVDTS